MKFLLLLAVAALTQLYDPSTVTTVGGTVDSTAVGPTRRGKGYSLQVMLTTPDGPLLIHIGPKTYLEAHDIHIQVNDHMIVTGSEIETDGSSYLIAKDIDVNGVGLQLRRRNGNPLW